MIPAIMAKLDEKTIETLVQLSRIQCSEEEKAALLGELQKILDYVEQLDELDTKNVPPCNHVLEGIANVMRDDEIGEIIPRETFLKNAPDQIGGMIKVPPVLRGDDA